MIKAIDTVYKGYKFRSRLEARWAVFFDAADIGWEYELEGYEFDDGIRYLPDFWLKDLQCYVEIKASKKETTIYDLKKAFALSKNSGKWVDIIFGKPGWPEEDFHILGIKNGSRFNKPTFGVCCECGSFGFTVFNNNNVREPAKYLSDFGFYGRCVKCGHGVFLTETNADQVVNALMKAKQSRFEFGDVDNG